MSTDGLLRYARALEISPHISSYLLRYARASVRAAFLRADTDHSGALSTRELEAELRKSGLDLPPAEMRAAIELFDDDGSGTIDIDEFLRNVPPLTAC